MNNKNGYTLVEILIAMAILAIMSAPMLNVFTDSIRINKIADDQYSSNIIAQKFVEDLRVNDFPDDLDSTISYEGFSVNVIYKELINDVATLETEVNSNFTLPSMDTSIELYVDTDGNIALKNNKFDFNNLDLTPNKYLLKIESPSTGNYNIFISHTDLSDANKKNLINVSTIEDRALTVRFFKNSNISFDDLQNITFEVLNDTKKDLEIYVTNDQLSNIKFLVDPSSNSVKLVRNVTDSTHVSSNTFKSYDVEVIVSKNNVEYTKLKTVISK